MLFKKRHTSIGWFFPNPISLNYLEGFFRLVWEELLSVGMGETVTYGKLAELVGHPGAARAVGQAMRSNPLPLLVPCHRVIRKKGATSGAKVSVEVGNYSGGDGPDTKRWLLEHEKKVTL